MRLVGDRKIITVWYHLHVTAEKARFMKTDSRMVLGMQSLGYGGFGLMLCKSMNVEQIDK